MDPVYKYSPGTPLRTLLGLSVVVMAKMPGVVAVLLRVRLLDLGTSAFFFAAGFFFTGVAVTFSSNSRRQLGLTLPGVRWVTWTVLAIIN